MSKFICTKCGYRWSETPGCKECRTFGYVVEDTEINHSKLIEALEQYADPEIYFRGFDEHIPDLLTIVREHEEQIPEILAEKQRLNRGYKLLIEPTCALCGKTHTSAYQGQCCAVETATRLKSKDAQQKSLIKMLIWGLGHDDIRVLTHPQLAKYMKDKYAIEKVAEITTKEQSLIKMLVEALDTERLAALEHEQWAHWTKYILNNSTPVNVCRWLGQSKVSYDQLSEEERESDRKWARRINGQALSHPDLAEYVEKK